MSFIPPNIILHEKDDQNNLNNNQNSSNNLKALEDEEKKLNIKNSNIDSFQFSKNNKKLKKTNSVENIFKKEELSKSIKMYSDEEVMHYVHLIFLNNSSYFPKKQQYLMSMENLIKIIKNFGIIPKEIKLYELDILVRKVCPKTNLISYENFMDILIKIAEKLFPKEYKKDKSLVKNFFFHNIFLSYNEIIFDNSTTLRDLLKYQYSSLAYLLNIIPEDSQILVMNSLLYTLNEIYEKYFIYELNYNHDHIYKSSENLNKFCVDFEIVPRTINSTQAMTYYNLSIHINEGYNIFNNEIKKYQNFKNKGIIFTIVHFMLFIIHISLYSYTKIFGSKKWTYDLNDSSISKETKLIIFLEKLEHSKGMLNFIQPLSWPTNKAFSLITDKEIFYLTGILYIYKKK